MNKGFIKRQLMKLNVICEENINTYINFCMERSQDKKTSNTAKHHILPQAKTLPFGKYSNFEENEWNCVYLKYDDHYLSHYLLATATDEYATISAFIAMHNKDSKINRVSENVLRLSEEYDALMKKRSIHQSKLNKNKVLAKDSRTGERVRVSKEEFDNNKYLVGHTKGKESKHLKNTISVLDKDGKSVRINKKEYNPEIHVGHTKGKTKFKDVSGNLYFVKTDDPRVLSGELVGINKNTKHTAKRKAEFKQFRKKFPEAGNAKRIVIYDLNGKPMFKCHGTMKITCQTHNLPFSSLTNSYRKGTKSKKGKYKGWYAQVLSKHEFDKIQVGEHK